MPKITQNEWLAELERLQAASQKNDDGMTTQEWAKALGCCKDGALRILAGAKEAGVLVRGSRMAEDVSGRAYSQTVYSIRVKAKRKSSKKLDI